MNYKLSLSVVCSCYLLIGIPRVALLNGTYPVVGLTGTKDRAKNIICQISASDADLSCQNATTDAGSTLTRQQTSFGLFAHQVSLGVDVN